MSAPPAPATPETDPNTNLVYEVLFEISDVEALGTLKWELFRVESLLRQSVVSDPRVKASDPVCKQLREALDAFDADGDVAQYRERFVKDAERLKFDELVRFYELALRVREQIHRAYVRYLEFVHDSLRKDLDEVDRDAIVRGAGSVEEGVRETQPRRTHAFVVHTKKSTREILLEVNYLDYVRVIEWFEQRIPRLQALLSEARLVYAQKGLAEASVQINTEIRNLVRVVAFFTAAAAIAAVVAILISLFG